jgi:POT family proton-dependent oligopeptide transporter
MSTQLQTLHLNKIFLVTQLIIYIISTEMGAFSYYGMRAYLFCYMTSSTLGDDAKRCRFRMDKPRSFSIIRMVYHVGIHNVNPGGMIADRYQAKGRSLELHLCLGMVF